MFTNSTDGVAFTMRLSIKEVSLVKEFGRSLPLIYFLFSLCSLLLSMNLHMGQCWSPSPSEVEPPLDVDHQGGEEALEVDLS